MAVKNGQSRDTGNIGHKKHITKTNKPQNTTQKAKTFSNMNPSNTGGEPRRPRRESSSHLPQDNTMPLIQSIRIRHYYAQVNINNVNKT